MTRRILEKVLGRVIPSPVGLAMENDVNPSPPSPRPAKFGPLATKIEQSADGWAFLMHALGMPVPE